MNVTFHISREDLAGILPERAVRQFEALQSQVSETEEALQTNVEETVALKDAAFVTLSANTELPNERVLKVGIGLDLEITDSGVKITAPGLARIEGGHRLKFVVSGDTEIALPLTGFVVTRETAETLANKTLEKVKLKLVQAGNDAAAEVLGVPIGGLYDNLGTVKVRRT